MWLLYTVTVFSCLETSKQMDIVLYITPLSYTEVKHDTVDYWLKSSVWFLPTAIPTSLSSLRTTPPHPEHSVHWWTRPGWRTVCPWSPWALTPDSEKGKISVFLLRTVHCSIFYSILLYYIYDDATLSSLSSSSSSHSNMASIDCSRKRSQQTFNWCTV